MTSNNRCVPVASLNKTNFTLEWSPEVARLCSEFHTSGVVGIDIAMAEFRSDSRPEECPHKQAFRTAQTHNIHRTVHAGEVGATATIYEVNAGEGGGGATATVYEVNAGEGGPPPPSTR